MADNLGTLARPARVRFVADLPKTRSGKLLHHATQAMCEQRELGNLTTFDNPSTLLRIIELIAGY